MISTNSTEFKKSTLKTLQEYINQNGINKVIFLGDFHFGVKGNSIDELRNQLLFLKEVFDYAKNINAIIIQLGDVFDNRKNLNIHIVNEVIDFFNENLKTPFISILGNHDIYFNSKRDVNSQRILSSSIENYYLVNDRDILDIQGKKFYFVSWLLENEKLSFDDIKDIDYLIGHFEIRDFKMVKGKVDETSELNAEFFNKNEKLKVFSGHYHLKSEKNNIFYVGTPYQINWNDFNEEKGMYIVEIDPLNGDTIDFKSNLVSKQYIKLIFEKGVYIEGMSLKKFGINTKTKLVTFDDVKEILENIKCEIKLIIKDTTENDFTTEIIDFMKQNKIKYSITDEEELNNLIEITENVNVFGNEITSQENQDNLENDTNDSNVKVDIKDLTSIEFIQKYLELKSPELLEVFDDTIKKITKD